MENLLNWFEIPATNFDRAVSFYRNVLKLEINEKEMFGTKMGFFASDDKNVSGSIVQGEGYSPSTNGVLMYLNGGKDLQNVLNRIETNQRKVLVPKTQISPEMGYFGIFMDTEGNKMAIHSIQ